MYYQWLVLASFAHHKRRFFHTHPLTLIYTGVGGVIWLCIAHPLLNPSLFFKSNPFFENWLVDLEMKT